MNFIPLYKREVLLKKYILESIYQATASSGPLFLTNYRLVIPGCSMSLASLNKVTRYHNISPIVFFFTINPPIFRFHHQHTERRKLSFSSSGILKGCTFNYLKKMPESLFLSSKVVSLLTKVVSCHLLQGIRTYRFRLNKVMVK